MSETVAIETPEPLSRRKRAAKALFYNRATAYLTTKAYDFMGPNVIPNRKLRGATLGALATVGIATSVLEFGYTKHFGGNLNVQDVLVHSGRHLAVGYAGACLAKKNGRADNLLGYIAYAEAANWLGAELGESIAVTGILHHGPQNIPSFLYPAQLYGVPGNNNIDDALMAATGSLIFGGQHTVNKWRSGRV